MSTRLAETTTAMQTMSGPAIEAIALTKTFETVTAVDRVDLRLAPGRIYGLLGPNGSGKTTLIRLLTGLARATSGTVRVLGVEMPSRSNLARIGYMTQSDGVYVELSVWENISFFAALYGTPDQARLHEVLQLVDLDDRRDEPVFQMSGGMRRRLSLACALVHRPAMLFLDEPTAGVDPALRVQFWSYFRDLAAGGTTLLVSSHVMDEADRCDELLLMLGGTVIARGTGAELRAQAGSPDLETAFLRLDTRATAEPGADDAEARDGAEPAASHTGDTGDTGSRDANGAGSGALGADRRPDSRSDSRS